MMQELNYIRCGDYYIPDIRLPKETRPKTFDRRLLHCQEQFWRWSKG